MDDVVGCIAVGMSGDDGHVWQSKDAVNMLRDMLTLDKYELKIYPTGARNEQRN